MKTLPMLAISLLLLNAAATLGASSVHAADGVPLLVKYNGSGFVMPASARYESCEVFSDQVVITRHFGAETGKSISLVESRNIKLNDGVDAVLKLALLETVTDVPNSMCDGPSTWTGINSKESGQILYQSGGCGTPRRTRNGPYSQMLVEILDQYCPQTNGGR